MRKFLKRTGVAVCAALFLGVSTNAVAEDVNTVDWFEREIGDGVVWKYYFFDNLFGANQSVSFIEADLTNPNVTIQLPYLASSRARTSSMVPNQFPNAKGAVNGTFFDVSPGGGGHGTYLRVGGTVVPQIPPSKGAWSWNGALAFNSAGDAVVIPMPGSDWSDDTTHDNIMANGPLLIDTGTIQSSSFTSIGGHCTTRHPRTAVGVTGDNRLILATVDGRTDSLGGMSCEELAQLMEDLGCTDALSMDGGGSTTLWAAGEPYNGVANYPSDNGVYDHVGERSCSNAIAVESTAPTAADWDGRLTNVSYSDTMTEGDTQTVTFTYQNIGTQTWTATDTRLYTSRPAKHASDFYDSGSWVANDNPALMSPTSVAPGGTATFTFDIVAPSVTTTEQMVEYFQLEQTSVGRFGPANNEARFELIVSPTGGTAGDIMIEARSGGQNNFWYSEDGGWADFGTNSSAPGTTSGIGCRYGSTYRSIAGLKRAHFTPNFVAQGDYEVYVTWPASSYTRDGVTYKVVHMGGTDVFSIDQRSNSNTWVRLGSAPYTFAAGTSGEVVMTNENVDVSGSMYASAVKFVLVTSVGDWMIY